MLPIWLGASLIVAGILFMAAQAIWRGPLSRPRRSRSAGATLEPGTLEAGAGFGLKANWPGLALVALGSLVLLASAAGGP